jgi:hypothetical protein
MLVAEVEELTGVIEAHGFMITGSAGQPVLNPALAARRAALEAIRRLDASSPPPMDADALDEFLDEG